MIIYVDELDVEHVYKLLIATIVPRAIGWVSSLSLDGVANLSGRLGRLEVKSLRATRRRKLLRRDIRPPWYCERSAYDRGARSQSYECKTFRQN
jgi:hypothetical protein